MMFSVVVPIYRNEASLTRLLEALDSLNTQLNNKLEVVFVVDGSPDKSFELLKAALPNLKFATQLLAHSRNFGSFAAIRSGLAAAKGEFCAVMAADLQEPPELLQSFFLSLANQECDVAIGKRIGRSDPWLSRVIAKFFWWTYFSTSAYSTTKYHFLSMEKNSPRSLLLKMFCISMQMIL